jgi:hypothetical protein
MTTNFNTPELRELTDAERQTVEGGGILNTLIKAIVSAINETQGLGSNLQKKDSDTESAIIGKI